MRTLAILLILLAGCASTEPTIVDETEEVHATETTGILRCVVVDATITPVADVMVMLAGSIQRTGEDGACAYTGIAPGVHNLTVSKAGYLPMQTMVQVDAGDNAPETVRVVLETDVANIPRVDQYVHKGRIICGTSLAAICGIGPLAEQTGDSHTGIIGLADETPSFLTVEAVWESTQPAGDAMELQVGSTPVGRSNTCCTVDGLSPLQVRLNGLAARSLELDTERDLFTRMLPAERNETNTDLCVPGIDFCGGPGVALQQDFEIFVHAFYNYYPDPDYRFTRDGEPTPP